MSLRSRTTALLFTTVLATVVTAAPAAAQIGGAYSTLVFGNVNVSLADIEGRLAVGGSLTASNYSFGALLAAAPQLASTPTVRVAGDASLTTATIYGTMQYGGTLTGSGVVGTTANVAPPADFFSYLQTQSLALSSAYAATALSSGAGVTNALVGATRTLSATSAGNYVFQLFSSGFGSLSELVINAPSNAFVIVNVVGSSADFSNKAFTLSGGITANHILFNFVDATSVTLSGVGFRGSVLAAKAALMFNNGHVDGDVVSQSFTGNGQINLFTFGGTLPVSQALPVTAVPEPATVVLLAAGLTLLGVVARRRRA